MKIAIRKEPNGLLYMDKDICQKNTISEEILVSEPYNYTIVEIGDEYADCKELDFNNDLTFNAEKYNARKIKEQNEAENKAYTNAIVSKIRERYSLDDELAILRQATTKPSEFTEYNTYVEECKAEVKTKN